MQLTRSGWGNTVAAAPDAVDAVVNGDGDQAQSVDMSSTSGLISNEFQVEVKLADLQADPNSPLYSVTKFEELPM